MDREEIHIEILVRYSLMGNLFQIKKEFNGVKGYILGSYAPEINNKQQSAAPIVRTNKFCYRKLYRKSDDASCQVRSDSITVTMRSISVDLQLKVTGTEMNL